MEHSKRRCVLLSMIIIGLYAYSEEGFVFIRYESFSEKILVDKSFEQYTRKMDSIAKGLSIKIMVQESFRVFGKAVENAIVIPFQKSNHYVGHALDINLVYNDVWYNSAKLKRYDELPEAIKSFIKQCKSNGLFWGGDLPVHDVVHFDDGLYSKDPVKYQYLFDYYQQ